MNSLDESFNEHSNNRPTLTALRNAYLLWPFTSVAGQDSMPLRSYR